MHVRKRVGGPRDRTKNGFLLVSLLYSELYGCFVVTCSEKERESRGVHRAI